MVCLVPLVRARGDYFSARTELTYFRIGAPDSLKREATTRGGDRTLTSAGLDKGVRGESRAVRVLCSPSLRGLLLLRWLDPAAHSVVRPQEHERHGLGGLEDPQARGGTQQFQPDSCTESVPAQRGRRCSTDALEVSFCAFAGHFAPCANNAIVAQHE